MHTTNKLAKYYLGKEINYVPGPNVREFECSRGDRRQILSIQLRFDEPVYDEATDQWIVVYHLLKNQRGEFEVNMATEGWVAH